MNWKKIENDDLICDYFVSDTGQVKKGEYRFYRVSPLVGRYECVSKEKLVALNLTSHTKPRVYVALETKSGKQKNFFVHRLVAQSFIENPKNKSEVNHIDGQPMNNKVDNLEWVSKSENEQHAYSNGLKINLKGSANPSSKLTENDVIEIKNRLSNGDSPAEISKDYPVDKMAIYKIKNGLRWSHIKNN